MSPTVSVVTGVYNAQDFVRLTIDSILGQSHKDLEYILVDDGSADRTVAVIEAVGDPRIKLLKNGENRKLIYTRNRAIGAASGDYICLTDHDDISLPTRIEEQLAFLADHPEIGLVGTWYGFIDRNGRPLPWKRARRRYSPEECRASLLFRNIFGHSTLLVRRSAMPDPPYVPDYQLCEDYDLIIRASKKQQIFVIPKILTNYRLTSQSFSNFSEDQKFRFAKEIKHKLIAELGIEPSARELDLHHSLDAHHLDTSRENLKDLRLWLERLMAANDRARIYETGALARVAGNEWFDICRKMSDLGLYAWRHYRRSRLSGHSDYGFSANAKLLLKCVVGTARGRRSRSRSLAVD